MHGHTQEGTKQNFVSKPFFLMFNKYNKQCKVGERYFNSYFYKKNIYIYIKCVMILKVMCVLILWLVLEIETLISD